MVFKNEVPLPRVYHKVKTEEQPSTLIVFLPGIFSGPHYYVLKGIIGDVKKSGLPMDSVAVDAHSGYYRDESLFFRLSEDIIKPARKEGYDNIWLVGVSLGGLGALLHAKQYPDSIDGVVALAPYFGGKEIQTEIKAAGGFRMWKPVQQLDPQDRYRSILLWLQQYYANNQKKPAIFLGYGRDDRFSDFLDMVAEIMPGDHVITLPGGHFWKTWRNIFNVYLEKDIFKSQKN